MNFLAGTNWLAQQVRIFAVALGGGLLLGCCWQAYGLLFRPLRRARRNWLGPDIVFSLLMLGLLSLWWFTLTDGSLRPGDFLWLGLGLVICLALPWPAPRRPRRAGLPKSAPPPQRATGSATQAASPDRAGASKPPRGPALAAATRFALALVARGRKISARRRQRRQARQEAEFPPGAEPGGSAGETGVKNVDKL